MGTDKNTKKKKDEIKVTITTMRLPVKLDDEDLLTRGRQLVENMRKAAAAEEERKAEDKKRKGDIALLDEITAKFSLTISTGSEDRDVECEIRKDYVHGSVTTVRTDTGEVVDERVMRAEERQDAMTFIEPEDREPVKGKGKDPFGKDEPDQESP
jgi:hypothetical protein